MRIGATVISVFRSSGVFNRKLRVERYAIDDVKEIEYLDLHRLLKIDSSDFPRITIVDVITPPSPRP